MPKMDDSTLVAICDAKLNNSLGWMGGLLSKERQLALSYYRGDAFGNEQEGRSQVVSRDVAESIDQMLPSLLKIFAAVDTVVACQPKRPDAEDAAKQATDYLNWVFQSQPNAFDLLQTSLKDGLMSKLGVVKSWWDESEVVQTEEYEGLTRFQYLSLLSDDEVEPIEVSTRSAGPPLLNSADPPQLPAPPAGMPGQGPPGPQIQPQDPPAAGPGALPQTPANFPGQQPPQGGPPPGAQGGNASPPQGAMITQPPMDQDDGQLYDCKIKRTTKNGRICIEAVPPEEFLTDRRAVSLDSASFTAHRCRRSVSDLIELGIDKKLADTLPGGDELAYNQEVINRFKAEDENPQRDDTDSLDPAMRQVWTSECYLQVDYDGDGVAEWRKALLGGGGGLKLLSNDETDGHPFAAWTPHKMPHKLYGESVADKTMDIQLIKSTVWRQVLDGMYFNNAPQLVVVEGQANMDDVLTRRPGGVIRIKSPGAVEPLPPQDVSQSGLGMMGYVDSVREARTGVRRWSAPLEGNELNPLAGTATGVNAVEDASQDTLELIARNYAEQLLKPLFKRLLKLICTHQQKKETVRLRGKWVDIDPSTWDSEMDMNVMVGLGTGDKARQVSQLITMLTQIDQPIVQLQNGADGPLLTMQNIYNKVNKIVEGMGYRSTENFYTDPSTVPPKPPAPPPPDPAMEKVKADAAAAQQKLQLDLQKAQATHQLKMEEATAKLQLQAHQGDQKAQQDQQLALEKMARDHEFKLAEMAQANALRMQELQAETDLKLLAIRADVHVRTQIERPS